MLSVIGSVECRKGIISFDYGLFVHWDELFSFDAPLRYWSGSDANSLVALNSHSAEWGPTKLALVKFRLAYWKDSIYTTNNDAAPIIFGLPKLDFDLPLNPYDQMISSTEIITSRLFVGESNITVEVGEIQIIKKIYVCDEVSFGVSDRDTIAYIKIGNLSESIINDVVKYFELLK